MIPWDTKIHSHRGFKLQVTLLHHWISKALQTQHVTFTAWCCCRFSQSLKTDPLITKMHFKKLGLILSAAQFIPVGMGLLKGYRKSGMEVERRTVGRCTYICDREGEEMLPLYLYAKPIPQSCQFKMTWYFFLLKYCVINNIGEEREK